MQDSKGLQYWVAHLSRSDLPVLKQTARELAALRADENRLTVLAVAGVIARDPMMTVKLLRYLQKHKHKVQTTEVIQIEQALLMLGIEPFFNHIAPEPVVEEVLQAHVAVLAPVLRVVHRSHRASQYAMDWAVRLRDLHYEEVRIAALLHDIAEILMWCFAPDAMLEIRAIQQQDKSLRSHHVQQQVLGFGLLELQKELALQWGLPKLLLNLMHDASMHQQRERNVALAINLARHSANGWDDAALPDDYKGIGDLLHIPAQEAMVMVGAEAGVVCDLAKPH
ncbi:MAG: Metal-dependent hydrolase HDOD [Candidatus Gallionella acididurans]|uniref:Metal-dependent hydrolase HDOD n=1 Tax=Candidatus Gallionella acididurans TaxID=1796491 RepID=A0A139BXR9_9PROT|nr:MAG: Metal-dependent hydrolase HDOD [Candidatus Gallionella acididurans]